MLGTLLRVLIGFALACLAAGIAVVAYVVTPAEIAALSGEAFDNRVADFVALALRAATHAAIFAAPFALILAAISEWQAVRGPVFYILGGIAIAMAGFLAQHWSETAGQNTVLNDYAIRAFLTTGLLSGLTYWLFAGRQAGGSIPADGEALPAQPRSATPAQSRDKDRTEPRPAKNGKAIEAKSVEAKAVEAKTPETKPAVKGSQSKA